MRIDPTAPCVVPPEPADALSVYQWAGERLWAGLFGASYQQKNPSQKIAEIMNAVSTLAPSRAYPPQKVLVGSQQKSAREALCEALELAVESNRAAIPAVSRRLLQLHPILPSHFTVFGTEITRQRIAKWAHSIDLPVGHAERQPQPSVHDRTSPGYLTTTLLYNRRGGNVHQPGVLNAMTMQHERMRAKIRAANGEKSVDVAMKEAEVFLETNFLAELGFKRVASSYGCYGRYPKDSLALVWNYICVVENPQIKEQLKESLAAKLVEIAKENPCSDGMIERIRDIPTAIDFDICTDMSVEVGALRDEMQKIAAAVSEKCDVDNADFLEILKQPGPSNRRDVEVDWVLTEVKREKFLHAVDVEFRIFRGLPAHDVALVAEQVFPSGMTL